jgi:uncharacterized surface protein with fasciclin (FAS1) repeats
MSKNDPTASAIIDGEITIAQLRATVTALEADLRVARDEASGLQAACVTMHVQAERIAALESRVELLTDASETARKLAQLEIDYVALEVAHNALERADQP